MALKPIGGEITAQDLNNNFSYLESIGIGKNDLPYVNVRDYGAVGDGVIDDTAAIQAAINDVGAKGGGVVVFPPGEYYTDTVVVRYSNVQLIGQGIENTKLTLKDMATGACIQIGEYNDTAIRGTLSNIAVQGFTIDGNKENQLQGSNTEDGIHMAIRVEDVSHVTISSVICHDCDGYGIGFVGSDLPNREHYTVRDIETYNNDYDGLDIKSGAKNVSLENVVAHNNGGGAIPGRDAVGIDVRGENVSLNNCKAYENQNHGIRLRANEGRKVSVSNCKSLDNTQDGFRLDGLSAEEYVLENCFSVGNRYGVAVEQGTYTLVNFVIKGNLQNGIHFITGFLAVVFVQSSIITENGLDGIRNDGSGELSVSNTKVSRNGRHGIYMQNNLRPNISNSDIHGNGANEQGHGVIISNLSNNWTITGSKIYNRSGEKQYRGIHFVGTSVEGILTSNYIRGNTDAQIGGAVPDGTQQANNLT